MWEKKFFSTLILKSRNRLFLLQTVRIIIAYRKPYQHPFAIACFECCDNIIKIKLSFPDKAKRNNLLTVDAVRSSIASSFNKCFFVNSPWHCASFTKQKALNNPLTRSGMPLKKQSTCSLRWDPSDICTKTRTSCLNQTHQSKRSINPLDLKTDSSMNTNLYTLSSVNKIAAGIVIYICPDATLGFSMIECQPLVT